MANWSSTGTILLVIPFQRAHNIDPGQTFKLFTSKPKCHQVNILAPLSMYAERMCFFLLETSPRHVAHRTGHFNRQRECYHALRQEFSRVLVRVTLCYTRNLQTVWRQDEYPWAIAGAGNRRCSPALNRRAHGAVGGLE